MPSAAPLALAGAALAMIRQIHDHRPVDCISGCPNRTREPAAAGSWEALNVGFRRMRRQSLLWLVSGGA